MDWTDHINELIKSESDMLAQGVKPFTSLEDFAGDPKLTVDFDVDAFLRQVREDRDRVEIGEDMKHITFEDNLTLQIFDDEGKNVYELDLEKLVNSAEVLDWIFQIKHKQWVTPQIMWELLEELDNVCKRFFGKGVQGTFCPFRHSKGVIWPVSGS